MPDDFSSKWMEYDESTATTVRSNLKPKYNIRWTLLPLLPLSNNQKNVMLHIVFLHCTLSRGLFLQLHHKLSFSECWYRVDLGDWCPRGFALYQIVTPAEPRRLPCLPLWPPAHTPDGLLKKNKNIFNPKIDRTRKIFCKQQSSFSLVHSGEITYFSHNMSLPLFSGTRLFPWEYFSNIHSALIHIHIQFSFSFFLHVIFLNLFPVFSIGFVYLGAGTG